MNFTSWLLLLVVLFSSSCATVFDGSKQYVRINSMPSGAEVYLNGNNTGQVTPARIKVPRKGNNGTRGHQIELRKDGMVAQQKIDRNWNATTLLSFLFFWPGVFIDLGTGAWWRYYAKYDYSLSKPIEEQELSPTPVVNGSAIGESGLVVAPATSTSDKTKDEMYLEGMNDRDIAWEDMKSSKYFSEQNKSNIAAESAQNQEMIASKKLTSQKVEAGEVKYRRSSLYTLMIHDPYREHAGVIKDGFGNYKMSGKFNDHNIGPYLISHKANVDPQIRISNYLRENNVARELVAKWFGRNESGCFNIDLVAERGDYDANAIDISTAKNSERGMSLIYDAGEELIGKTFVVVTDYKFMDKEEIGRAASNTMSLFGAVADLAGADALATASNLGAATAAVAAKGYVVKATSYLYQLDWSEATSNTFYTKYWCDQSNPNSDVADQFNNSSEFKLKYIGEENAWADVQSTVFTTKSDVDLIRKATVKAVDKSIAKLQRTYETFRTKSPLYSGDPLSAKIGLKEGLEKGDKFEVLEQVIDKNGRTTYKRKGIIKVDPKNIWDNRFGASEQTVGQQQPYTLFQGSKNYYSGMLIRQIN